MSSAGPLTPAEALAVAAILEAHKRLPPSWQHVADRLRAWARTQTAATEEGEMPSQDGIPRAERDRIGGIKQAPSGVLSGPPAQGSNPSGGAMQIVPESGAAS